MIQFKILMPHNSQSFIFQMFLNISLRKKRFSAYCFLADCDFLLNFYKSKHKLIAFLAYLRYNGNT